MDSQKYKLSFTAASLSILESIIIAEVYLGCKDWDETKAIIKENNLLQSRTSSRDTRVFQELSQRLSALSGEELDLVANGVLEERKQMLWYAICNTYAFIQEFAIEIVHEKFLSLNLELSNLDYEAFYNRKADWHPELEEITELTQQKLRQVVFQMLREAGLISDSHTIIPVLLSPRVEAALQSNAPSSYQIFPIQLSSLSGG
jgi:hypothetical protein